MDDFRKIFFGIIIGFLLVIIVWISMLTFFGCASSLNCPTLGGPTPERTSIPTLVPATLPPLSLQLGSATTATAPAGGTAAAPAPGSDIPKPSNPGGPGPAVNLTGSVDSGKTIFASNCAVCHGAEGKGGNPNPGSTDGTVPPLNPIDPLLGSPDRTTFVTNIDLFLEHGSTPEGPGPTFSMPAWGDKKLLMPQQIADVISYVISLNPAAAVSQPPGAAAPPPAGTSVAAAATSAPGTAAAPPPAGTAVAATPAAGTGTQTEPEPTEEVARPSNPGGPGPAVDLAGDANSGQTIFAANCQICHGTEGKGGNPNPGSSDGTIPPLNPIDSTLISTDPKTFAGNLDLFLEHGSTPEGPGPTFSMPAWGDKKLLTPQQIADVIAYVMGLNK